MLAKNYTISLRSLTFDTKQNLAGFAKISDNLYLNMFQLLVNNRMRSMFYPGGIGSIKRRIRLSIVRLGLLTRHLPHGDTRNFLSYL